MKIIKKTWLIFTLIIISVLSSGQDTSPPEILAKADFLYANQEYEAAIKEYQRYIFYSGSENVEILLKVAAGLYEMGKYDLSLQYYEQIYYLSSDDEIKFQSRLKETTHHISQKDYNKALIELYTLSSGYYELHPEIIDFLFGVCHFGLEEFNKAEEYFLKITASSPETSARIKEIFADEKQFYKPNPNTISILSLFIPGLGQMLTGSFKEAGNSFILVGGIGTAMVIVALRLSIWDAILSLVPWYQRYLVGGSENAEQLAIEKRSQNRNKIYLEILEVLAPYEEKFEIGE